MPTVRVAAQPPEHALLHRKHNSEVSGAVRPRKNEEKPDGSLAPTHQNLLSEASQIMTRPRFGVRTEQRTVAQFPLTRNRRLVHRGKSKQKFSAGSVSHPLGCENSKRDCKPYFTHGKNLAVKTPYTAIRKPECGRYHFPECATRVTFLGASPRSESGWTDTCLRLLGSNIFHQASANVRAHSRHKFHVS